MSSGKQHIRLGKKGKKSSGLSSRACGYCACVCVCGGVVLVGLILILLASSQHFYTGDSAFSVLLSPLLGRFDKTPQYMGALSKYEEVLRRAKELTLRVRNASGTDSVHDQAISTITRVNANATMLSFPEPQHQTSLESTVQKDIVIGIAQDTDAKNLVVFCASLRSVSPTSEVVIFVNSPIPQRHQEIADANKIKLVSFDKSSLSSAMQNFHPSTLRWPLIYRFFQNTETRAKYKRVWMADVRDSYFQEDPFKMLLDGKQGFYAFQGVESVNIRDCGWNSGWVKDCFGAETLAKVGNNKIICSGVSMGDMNSVYEYLQLVDDIVMARGRSAIAKVAKFPTCERNGVDQGIHNVLVHQRLIPNLKIWTHNDGPVANLQAQKSRLNNGQVFNQVGDVVAVVHQYDRRPDLQKMLFSKHVYWIDTNDAEAEWNAEPACKAFATRKSDADMFKGICDMKSQGGATSAASCCSFCQKRPGCKAFTFYSSVCFLKSCSQSRHASSLPGAVSAGFA